jgi:hypothetical protein
MWYMRAIWTLQEYVLRGILVGDDLLSVGAGSGLIGVALHRDSVQSIYWKSI